MKKFFTLIAAVAMAASVNAQGTYAVAEGEVPTANSTITSVPNITMTWGNNTWKDNKLVEDKFDSFLYKVTGTENPSLSDGIPTSGAYVVFEPTIDGTVSFAYKLNKNKKQYFIDEEGNNVIDPIAETTGSSIYPLTDFAVKANKKYYTYTAGSKMDVFGFKFTEGTSGINSAISEVSADADAATYNVLGQKVASNAKGLVIKNGKKFINK